MTYSDPWELEGDQHDKNKRLLDPANTQQFDDFKKCYGEILYRWGLREKRAEVLKFVSCPPDPHKGIGEYDFVFPGTIGKALDCVCP